MKSQYNIIIFAILNVVCYCYPSPSESDQIEKLFNPSENISPCDNIQENHFPEVYYPTKMLDTIELYYYRAADHDDILAPFTSDVKDAYNSLDAEKKGKDTQHTQHAASEEIMELKAPEAGASIESAEIVTSELLNAEGTEDITSESNEDILQEPQEAQNESNVEVPEELESNNDNSNIQEEFETTHDNPNVEELKDATIVSSTEEAENTYIHSNLDESVDIKTESNVKTSNIEQTNISTVSTETSLPMGPEHSNETV